MKFAVLALVATLLPFTAHAGSAVDPVQRIMDVASARWDNTEGGGKDYFDAIDRDFSKDFIAVYRGAQKYPAYDGSDQPFDYDVITSSQDGCPLKDVRLSPAGEKDGVTTIDVSFRLWACVPDDSATQAKVSELRFDVVMEGGKPVISDIHRLNEGKWETLVGEMKENIAYGEKNAQQ
jgi:hypothetical protein